MGTSNMGCAGSGNKDPDDPSAGGSGSADRGGSSRDYDLESGEFAEHYRSSEVLGRGAYGVVKATALRSEAVARIRQIPRDELELLPAHVNRRRRFLERELAVKIMRQQKQGGQGDSCDRLEVQILELQKTLDKMEKDQHSGQGQEDEEEVQWHRDHMQALTSKLQEKRRNRTKQTPREMMLREVKLLEKCDHKFVIQLVESFDTAAFYMVFERCYGSVLSRYPNGIRDLRITAICGYQLLSACAYLHRNLVLHRDIKPENVLFRTRAEGVLAENMEIVLSDFGMAVELRKPTDRCQGCAGTPHFVPPEGFHSYYQSFPSDAWACGCSIYWMLLGVCPFEVAQDEDETAKNQIKTTGLYGLLRSTRMGAALAGWKPQFEHEHTASLARKICHPSQHPPYCDAKGKALAASEDEVRELLGKLLRKLPRERLSPQDALLHPYFAEPHARWGEAGGFGDGGGGGAQHGGGSGAQATGANGHHLARTSSKEAWGGGQGNNQASPQVAKVSSREPSLARVVPTNVD